MNEVEDHPLTDAQIDAIATKAAEKALQLVYAEVGQNVLKKLAWLVGVATIGIVIFLAGKDALPK
jgi:phage terminase Nu1 subunit (DNA packaging protein)